MKRIFYEESNMKYIYFYMIENSVYDYDIDLPLSKISATTWDGHESVG